LHAGLEEGKLNLIVFDNEDTLRSLLEGLGLEVGQGKKILRDGKAEKCSCCDEPLTTKNLGNLMPGSLELFCDRPTCLAGYILRYRGH